MSCPVSGSGPTIAVSVYGHSQPLVLKNAALWTNVATVLQQVTMMLVFCRETSVKSSNEILGYRLRFASQSDYLEERRDFGTYNVAEKSLFCADGISSSGEMLLANAISSDFWESHADEVSGKVSKEMESVSGLGKPKVCPITGKSGSCPASANIINNDKAELLGKDKDSASENVASGKCPFGFSSSSASDMKEARCPFGFGDGNDSENKSGSVDTIDDSTGCTSVNREKRSEKSSCSVSSDGYSLTFHFQGSAKPLDLPNVPTWTNMATLVQMVQMSMLMCGTPEAAPLVVPCVVRHHGGVKGNGTFYHPTALLSHTDITDHDHLDVVIL